MVGGWRASVRIWLEATGVYSLDVSMALEAVDGIMVAVLNPRRFLQFAETLRRSNTDAVSAAALAEYSLRMPFRSLGAAVWSRARAAGD